MTDSQLLEDRITSLERKIYGLEKLVTMDDDTVFETSVIDNLLHANTLISSALSGREKANAAIKRLPELSDYLNPNYEESLLPTEAKLQLIMTMEPEIRENHQLYSKMQELLPVLETSRLKDVPELSHKLNDLTVTYLQTYERTKDLTSDVNDIFSKYNTVMDSISKSLITLDAAVTAAEIAAMPKKHIDD